LEFVLFYSFATSVPRSPVVSDHVFAVFFLTVYPVCLFLASFIA